MVDLIRARASAESLAGRFFGREFFRCRFDDAAQLFDLRDVAAAGFAGEKMQFESNFFAQGKGAFAGVGDERHHQAARRQAAGEKIDELRSLSFSTSVCFILTAPFYFLERKTS